MVAVRNTEQELHQFRIRVAVAVGLVVTCFVLLAARFAWLQVVRHDQLSLQAEENRIQLVPIAPTRGLIVDRHGVVIAENVSAYTLELQPGRIENLEQTITEISGLVEISIKDRRRFRRLFEDSKSAESIPLKSRLTDEEVAILAANRFRLPGVEVRARLFRSYPLGETGSHLIGHIGRISPADKLRLEESEQSSQYIGSTQIGKVGVELSYEKVLHGQVGYEEIEVSAGGRPVRTLSRRAPQAGSTVVLSIDLGLQKLVEDMFGDRRGALVAIDPRTGEILAFVSKPTFDPNLFTDGVDPQVWQGYNESPDKPLLNRPLRGTYPPGSTYKPFMALAALESGKRAPGTTIYDPGYFQFGGHKFRDSNPRGNGAVDLHRSIVVSSDTYYYMVANDMGVDAIHDFMKPWGFGQLTGIDLEGEVQGILPSSAWKLRRYKQKWLAGETISIGIGQGYNTFTILQLAHATATLAADGAVRPPRVVRALENPSTRGLTPVSTPERERIALKPEWLKLVKAAMVDVNRFGTGRHAFAGAPYAAAGKTGTAQVIGIKQNERYDARRISERYRDHSLFMAFAPADNPQIALAVIVENAGFGAAAAAPIARRAIDYVLLGKRPEGDPVKAVTIGIASEDPSLRDVPDGPQPEPDPVPAVPGAPGAPGAPGVPPGPPIPATPTPGPAPVRPAEQERR
ncbi:MAG: penicillin-binding protein 2 [Betaproteobacteria bacterium]|nr:penicillin-binding protein 2 [Betaproteobacteria bacterium]